MPRSGTNLMRRIVGSHSQIAMPPTELRFFQRLAQGQQVRDLLSAAPFKEKYGLAVDDLYTDGRRSAEDIYRELLERYAQQAGKPIVGEKSPRNEFHLRRIKASLPGYDVRVIHLVRNPLDVAASLKYSPHRQPTTTDSEFSAKLRVFANNWVRSLGLGLARSYANPSTYCVVQYERLTLNARAQASQLVDFLGVRDETDRMLNSADFMQQDNNTSFPTLEADQPPGDQGIIKAARSRKSHLDKTERELVADICGEYALAFGYDDDEFLSGSLSVDEKVQVRQPLLTRLLRTLGNSSVQR